MNADVEFYLWTAYAMAGVLCIAELGMLALRYRNIRDHLGWRRRRPSDGR